MIRNEVDVRVQLARICDLARGILTFIPLLRCRCQRWQWAGLDRGLCHARSVWVEAEISIRQIVQLDWQMTGIPDAIDCVNDPSWCSDLRVDLIDKARSAMTDMNGHNWGNSINQASEMNFLVKALGNIE